jgi:hypothetical protein
MIPKILNGIVFVDLFLRGLLIYFILKEGMSKEKALDSNFAFIFASIMAISIFMQIKGV